MVRSKSLPYLPGLDGLRAIAVIAVVLYHLGFGWAAGGFLGVDVFFVISGYLITSLLHEEWVAERQIDLRAFWLRRARRLLPAAFVLILAVLSYAIIFIPEEASRLREDALASAGYITNWRLIFSQQSYFEAVGRPPLLRHLWSLAVEEQFYLLWPLLFGGGMMLLRRRRYLLPPVLALAAASSVGMALLYQPDVDPSRVYYGTDTRATGLLLGAALALVRPPSLASVAREKALVKGIILDLVGVLSLAILLYFFFSVNEFQPFLYRGGFALVALTSAALIAVTIHPASHIGRLLGRQPLRWIGTRSYGLYLWHWPVFMLTRPYLDVSLDGPALLALRLAMTVVLVELSYRLIENPVRAGALGRAWRSLRQNRGMRKPLLRLKWAAAAVSASTLLVLLVIAAVSARPPLPASYLSVSGMQVSAPLGPSAPPAPAVPLEVGLVASPLLQPFMSFPAEDVIQLAQPLPASVPPFSPAPSPSPLPRPSPAITAIGDSVMLGAGRTLVATLGGVEVDAEVGRQVTTMIDILQARRASGQLGEVVIIQGGDNGTFSGRQFDEIMKALDGVRKVVFVNVKVPRQWEGPNNAVLREGVERHPHAILVDWHGASRDRPEFFWEDGIHLRPEGAEVYASLIAAAVAEP